MVRVPNIKLNNGLEMPVLGLGTYQSKPNEVAEAVKHAIDHGYRHIDTAFSYGNEKEVGAAIKEKIAEGVVKREDIYLVTKLWCIHHDPSKVEHACRKSLENLGLDYIDLYLMHNPVGFVYVDDSTILPKKQESDEFVIASDIDYLDTWKAMEQLVKKGLVRSIGLSNFNAEQTERLLKNAEVKPVTNQVECHIELNQKKLRELSKQYGIILTAYCPLAQHNPVEKKPAFLYDDRTIAIAKKYNKTPAQVAIRYLLQIGTIPIPKSVTKSRIEENINVFDFELNSDEIKILEQQDCGNRIARWPFINPTEKYYPFNAEF
ncbi:unnamed protein product [Hermetia illucens]|uniref:NADP-dependent oxidoreductase domain-containing protein n=1 Tax=Hermetia illucens TaxID=343691 RepID=A0A7R8ULK7_HERIL|nr:aldo-keto reductase family 1 member B1-like [Hermetia illucens]CAD7083090.1 unnamed protein product [Hermetia illucens]